MPSSGYIQVRCFASKAQLPLEGVAVSVTAQDGTAIAFRLTDRSGKTDSIEVPTPAFQDSQEPNPPEQPFTTVNIHAHLQGYEQVSVTGVQVFADTGTLQELEMVPRSEFPDYWNLTEDFITTPQNL